MKYQTKADSLLKFMLQRLAPIAAMVCCTLLLSCNNTGYTRAYIISKTDDNNWSTSGIIECDSFTMESNNRCVFYVDGRKSVMIGKIIELFSNTSYIPVK